MKPTAISPSPFIAYKMLVLNIHLLTMFYYPLLTAIQAKA